MPRYNTPRMFRPRLTALIGIALAFALAGCHGTRAVRGPDDAYVAGTSAASPEDLEAARAEIARRPGSPEGEHAAWALLRDAYDNKRFAEVEERLAALETASPASPWLPPAVFVRLLAARDTEGSLRLIQRVDEALKRFVAVPAFQAGARALLPDALAACSES